MTERVVLDASVVAKWFLPEHGSDAAVALLKRIRAGEVVAAAPELLPAEIGNVLWKRITQGQVQASAAVAILNALRDSPLEIHAIHPLVTTALEIAVTTGATVYDAIYVALATQLDATVATADAKLAARLRGSVYASRVQLI